MSRRILIVDDEPLNLDLLSQELADLGHVTENAASGADALKKMRGFDPELIFLDYQMPGMNGIEVLREIRKQDKNLPVIIITAYGTIERAVEAIKTGADDFITKPFDPEHLAVVVKKALERAELKSEVEFLARELGGRYLPGAPGQASQISPGERVRTRGRESAHRRRCASHRRNES